MWKKIKAIFFKIGDFLLDFVSSRSGQIINEIGAIAYKVVREVENLPDDMSGEEKFEAAYSKLVAELGKAAGKYSVSILNAAIEIAVQVLKSNNEEKKK